MIENCIKINYLVNEKIEETIKNDEMEKNHNICDSSKKEKLQFDKSDYYKKRTKNLKFDN